MARFFGNEKNAAGPRWPGGTSASQVLWRDRASSHRRSAAPPMGAARPAFARAGAKNVTRSMTWSWQWSVSSAQRRDVPNQRQDQDPPGRWNAPKPEHHIPGPYTWMWIPRTTHKLVVVYVPLDASFGDVIILSDIRSNWWIFAG